MAQILASLDDINANLPAELGLATDDNTALLQVSVARVVRGYLSRVVENAVLQSWDSPEDTPEIVREAAGKMIAAMFYFNNTAATTTELSDSSFAQRRYNEAIALLDSIIAGEIPITGVVTDTEAMSDLDYFPIDDTDRAFTLSQPL